MKYYKGDIIKVKVTAIENYGLFVKVDNKYSGLIHISELTNKYVSNVRNYAFPGEIIYAEIIDIDSKNYNMKLSIKNIDYRINVNSQDRVIESPNGFKKLEEKLPVWIDEKLQEIKKIK